MVSSKRFEDLKDELSSIEDKIRLQVKHNINEVTLNKLCSEGDAIVLLMKREVDSTPVVVKTEMSANWTLVSSDWKCFKTKTRSDCLAGVKGFGWTEPNVGPNAANVAPNEALSRGIRILERTNESVLRAEMVSRESEAIGHEVIDQLGEQRESLVRTRARLDGTSDDLKTTRVLLRSINRRLLTNKCLLIFIAIIEIVVLLVVVYIRFIKK